ncbi:MAG TPA: hypothetical protein PKA39_09205 [Ignavibacteria bacterium]|mgnify:FL=1|jgi:hypothetical protein|nr:hypothetical protein [Ignavibacteria bacterium]
MPEISEYKGNKLICLNPGAKFTFSFGLGKAKMILENLDAIKTFVETNGESCGDNSAPAGGEGSSAEPF